MASLLRGSSGSWRAGPPSGDMSYMVCSLRGGGGRGGGHPLDLERKTPPARGGGGHPMDLERRPSATRGRVEIVDLTMTNRPGGRGSRCPGGCGAARRRRLRSRHTGEPVDREANADAHASYTAARWPLRSLSET